MRAYGGRNQESIVDLSLGPLIDMVVALHACDTATDDALYRAIAANAQLIFVAPCCHKELRPQLPLFMHGIQSDRMAEAITDALRCMYLDASGYVTRVQEFIALEHTAKNLLRAVRRLTRPRKPAFMLL